MLILWLTIFSVASPFLDVLEGLIDDEDEEEQTASDHGNSADDDNDSDELLRRCTSDADFSLSESDKDQKDEYKGAAGSEMEKEDSDHPMFDDDFY